MKSQRGGFVTGLVVGLLIGLGVALGVALYITKAPVPFINKVPLRNADQDAAEAERNKNWDPNAPLAGKNPARPAAPAAPPAAGVDNGMAGGHAPADATLPAVITPQAAVPTPAQGASAGRRPRDPAALLAGQPAAAALAAAASKAATPAAVVPTKPASAPVTSYFVQAGAYARTDDAEAQRVKLALMGMGAKITEREQAGRTVYRVRLGPFDNRDEAESAQGKLASGGVEANLVRVER
jgi:cell division protein FtsN